LGWAVSQLILLLMYFGPFTPIGLVFRLVGRIDMERDRLRRDPSDAPRAPLRLGTFCVRRLREGLIAAHGQNRRSAVSTGSGARILRQKRSARCRMSWSLASKSFSVNRQEDGVRGETDSMK
jgi:hypothetical protein